MFKHVQFRMEEAAAGAVCVFLLSGDDVNGF